MVGDLAAAQDPCVVDRRLTQVRLHLGLEEDGVAGLHELVRREDVEISERLQVAAKVLLEGGSAGDLCVERDERCIVRVLVVDETLDVARPQEPDLVLVEPASCCFLRQCHAPFGKGYRRHESSLVLVDDQRTTGGPTPCTRMRSPSGRLSTLSTAATTKQHRSTSRKTWSG